MKKITLSRASAALEFLQWECRHPDEADWACPGCFARKVQYSLVESGYSPDPEDLDKEFLAEHGHMEIPILDPPEEWEIEE